MRDIDNKAIPVVTMICPVCNGSGEDEYSSPCGDASSITDTCIRCGGSGVVVRYINPITERATYTRIPM